MPCRHSFLNNALLGLDNIIPISTYVLPNAAVCLDYLPYCSFMSSEDDRRVEIFLKASTAERMALAGMYTLNRYGERQYKTRFTSASPNIRYLFENDEVEHIESLRNCKFSSF